MGLLQSLLCSSSSPHFRRPFSRPNLETPYEPSRPRAWKKSPTPMTTARTPTTPTATTAVISHPYPLIPRRRCSSSPEHRLNARLGSYTPEPTGVAQVHRNRWSFTAASSVRAPERIVHDSSLLERFSRSGRVTTKPREQIVPPQSDTSSPTYSPPDLYYSHVRLNQREGAGPRKLRKVFRVEGGWEMVREEEYGSARNRLAV